MGTVEVVGVDEEAEPLRAIGVVREDGAGEKLVPQRLPEALHLADGLRVLRPALDVPDAIASQLALEVRLAPPRRVLPALVGEDLLRSAVGGEAPGERLHHQLRALVVRQRVRDDEARVVVHERRQVEPLMASEQEREDVRLPELVGAGPLEASVRVIARRRRLPGLEQARLVQDAADRRLRDAERLEAREHVGDPPRPEFGVLLADGDHRVALRLLRRRRLTPGRRCRRLRDQRVHASRLVGLDPLLDGRHARAEDPGELPQADVAPHRLFDHPHPQRQRVRLAHPRQLARVSLSSLSPHDRRLPSLRLSAGRGGTVLSELKRAHPPIRWRAGHPSRSRHPCTP